MAQRRHRISTKSVGTPPGTLTYVGQEIEHATHVTRIEFSETDVKVDDSGKLSNCRLPGTDAPRITWVDVDGIHEPQVVGAIGRQFHLHPLLLEDVVNSEQKPKIDFYDDDQAVQTATAAPIDTTAVLFVTMKMLYHNGEQHEIDAEHVSLVLGEKFLISFQEERTADIFEPILDRIRAAAGKTRRHGADYLLYTLMDLIVDNYFLVLERIGDSLDELEDVVIQNKADQSTLSKVYALKREVTFMRRVVWPLRDVVGAMLREESPLIAKSTVPFLRDLADHINQLIETLDAYRDLTTGLVDIYLSTASNRMNSVMKTLTVFSAIFMPLTFIVGVYGMNFTNMPELKTKDGYFVVWGVMLVITAGMLVYFRRRGWI